MKDSLFFRVVFVFGFAVIFIGDVKIPVTVPISMLISAVYLVRIYNMHVTLPFIFLLNVLLPGLLNLIISGYFDIERDHVIYLPVLYGLYVLLFVGGFTYHRRLEYALIVGAMALCLWIFMAFFTSFGDVGGYYQLKSHAETPLGRSNYLAVFIGFCLMVLTFRFGWSFIILLLVFLLMMSRTGIVLILVFMFFRFITVRQNLLRVFSVAAVLLALSIYYWDLIYYYLDYVLEGALGTESVNIRLRAWYATIDILQINPLFGVPRSLYKDALELAVPGDNLWDPHNSVLHLLVSFGLLGFVFYAAYVAVIFREICQASLTDKFWKGVFWGYSLILVWSLFEQVLLTPAIEILQAYLFVLARKYRSSLYVKSEEHNSKVSLVELRAS